MKRWTGLATLLLLAVLAGLLLSDPSEPGPSERSKPVAGRSAGDTALVDRPRGRVRVDDEAGASAIRDIAPEPAAPLEIDDLVELRVQILDARGEPTGGWVRVGDAVPVNSDASGHVVLPVATASSIELQAGTESGGRRRLGRVSVVGPTTLRVRIPDLIDFRVSVVGPDGQAVSGADVLIAERLADDFAVHAFDTTDAEGRLAVRRVPPVAFQLLVRHDDFATTVHHVQAGRATASVELAAARTVRGVVTSGGEPVFGAVVFQGDSVDLATVTRTAAFTDADGRFELKGVRDVPSGWIHVKHDTKGTGSVCLLETGDADGVRIVLDAGTPIDGMVVDVALDEPVPGVIVCVNSGGPGWAVKYVTTDAEGRFVARAGLECQVAERTPRWQQVGSVSEDSDDGAESIVLHVLRKPAIEGRVVDERGGPVAGARVVAGGMGYSVREWSVREWANAAAYTDEAGRFRLDDVRSRFVSEVIAKHVEHGEGAADVAFRPFEDATGVHVSLLGWGSISGRVVDDTGRAAPGVRVHVYDVSGVHAEEFEDGTSRPLRGVAEPVKTGANGHFSFGGLARGTRYTIVAWPHAHSDFVARVQKVNVTTATTSVPDLDLRRKDVRRK